MCNRTNSSELDNTGGIYLAAARNLRICLLLFPTHNGRSRSWNQENVEQNLLGGRADPGLQDAPLPSVDQDAHHGIQGRDEQHVRQEGEEGDDEHPCPEGAVEGDAPEQQGASVPRKNCGCVSGRGTGGGGAVAVDLFPLRRGQFSDSEEVCGARNFVQRGPECENAHGLGVFRDDAWRKIQYVPVRFQPFPQNFWGVPPYHGPFNQCHTQQKIRVGLHSVRCGTTPAGR
mmetsp:Transcript_19697/g.39190  ORF Transcript_19697/g.39190 Transcript_19697/m.39190 type:complete len:230 (-) Transcript_19697:341-1030(-)